MPCPWYSRMLAWAAASWAVEAATASERASLSIVADDTSKRVDAFDAGYCLNEAGLAVPLVRMR